MLSKIFDFLRVGIWHETSHKTYSPIKRVGLLSLKTVLLVIRGFSSKRLNVSANSLTYSLIFSIVPILAMILAVARGFGFEDIIYNSLNQSFLKETNMVPEIMEMVNRYLETAQGGVFIGIGILVLLWAVYSFFNSVETLFNGIWNVQQSRSIFRQTVTYVAILFFIPILIIVSSGISVFFQATSSELPILTSFKTDFLRLIQFGSVWIVFSWLYKVIPNTKVNMLSAVIPGVLMGTLYQLIQMLSVYVLMFLSRTSIVYGAFASIPILLTWLQWTCLLILIGAQMSYAIQNNEQFAYEKDLQKMSRRYKDSITIFVLSVIVHRFEKEQPPCSSRFIAQRYNLPIRLINQVISRLVEINLLNELYVEDGEDTLYQPAIDTHKISLGMIIDRIDNQGIEDFILQADEDFISFGKRLEEILSSKANLNDILVSEI